MDTSRNLSLLEACKCVTDPRKHRVNKFELCELLFIAFVSVMCGCDDYWEMANFAKVHLDWFRNYLPYTNGMPSEATLERIMGMIKPEELNEAFLTWMLGALDLAKAADDGGLVHIDGKATRGSRTSDGKAAHVVSAFLSASRMILAQTTCDKKSNEITAIPSLIKMLELRGCLVTIDAGGTYLRVANAIKEAGADYLLPVKGNQPKLSEAIQAAFEDYVTLPNWTTDTVSSLDCFTTEDKGHGREEKRECIVLHDTEWMGSLSEKWQHVQMAAAIRSTVTEKGKTTSSVHYYICSREGLSASTVLEIKRAHWGIESAHWILDVALGDDACKAQADHSAKNLTVARHIALNVLRKYKETARLKGRGSTFKHLMKQLEQSDEMRSAAVCCMNAIAGKPKLA